MFLYFILFKLYKSSIEMFPHNICLTSEIRVSASWLHHSFFSNLPLFSYTGPIIITCIVAMFAFHFSSGFSPSSFHGFSCSLSGRGSIGPGKNQPYYLGFDRCIVCECLKGGGESLLLCVFLYPFLFPIFPYVY